MVGLCSRTPSLPCETGPPLSCPPTKHLVDALRQEAQGVKFAGLVVGFADRTEFVAADDPAPLAALDAPGGSLVGSP